MNIFPCPLTPRVISGIYGVVVTSKKARARPSGHFLVFIEFFIQVYKSNLESVLPLCTCSCCIRMTTHVSHNLYYITLLFINSTIHIGDPPVKGPHTAGPIHDSGGGGREVIRAWSRAPLAEADRCFDGNQRVRRHTW